jgi:hypothetical protein
MAKQKHLPGPTRREVVKKAAYVAPAVLTLAVSPALGSAASRPPLNPPPPRQPPPRPRR